MKLFLTKKAQKHFEGLDQSHQTRVLHKLELLEKNPYVGKKLAGKLVGFYTLRVWPYRVIYQVNKKQQEIWVVSILHRQGSYKA